MTDITEIGGRRKLSRLDGKKHRAQGIVASARLTHKNKTFCSKKMFRFCSRGVNYVGQVE